MKRRWYYGFVIILCTLILESCNRGGDKICQEDSTLVSYLPHYSSCDPLLQEYTVEYDTIYKPMETDCFCESNREKLEDSFWDIVDTQPENEQFMYYESPAYYKCVK